MEEPEIFIMAPSFDHKIKDPILDDIRISSQSRVAIIEGNYTLLDESPWNKIALMVDERYAVFSHATCTALTPGVGGSLMHQRQLPGSG